jgi:hypothetical protein
MTTDQLIFIGIMVVVSLCSFGVGFSLGHFQGVRETEKRWANTVGKAKDRSGPFYEC